MVKKINYKITTIIEEICIINIYFIMFDIIFFRIEDDIVVIFFKSPYGLKDTH